MRISCLLSKLVLFLLIVPGSLWPAGTPVDILIPQTPNLTIQVGRGLVANASGNNGFLNNWIMTFPQGYTYACIGVHNPGTGSVIFNMAAYTSLDGSVNSFTGNASSWTQVPVQGNKFGNNASISGYSVSAASTALLLARLSGASKLDLSPTLVNSSTIPLDLFVSLNNNGQCGTIDWNTIYFYDARPSLGAASTTVNLIGPTSSFTFFNDMSTVKQCQVTIITTNNAGTNPTLNVRLGAYDPITGWEDDRISFTQFTSGVVYRTASLAQYVSAVDRVLANFSLAAGTEQQGMFTGGLEVNYAIGGTVSPNYTIILEGACSR